MAGATLDWPRVTFSQPLPLLHFTLQLRFNPCWCWGQDIFMCCATIKRTMFIIVKKGFSLCADCALIILLSLLPKLCPLKVTTLAGPIIG